MAVIQTLDELQILTPNWQPGIFRSGVRLYNSFNYDYAALYRMQPNVRVCVDFLARNIAQLNLHVYRRVADTNRVRLTDHGLAQLLKMPLPPASKQTRYRLIESLISDLGIYFNAYWLKLMRDNQVAGLLRLPPVFVKPLGNLVPNGYEMTISGRRKIFEPEEIVHFRGYNPENPISGLSPLETLRRTLAEEHAAGEYREGMWMNAARMHGFLQRPSDAPEWSEDARERFLADFAELYSGGENSGKTAILEEGMTWVPASFNAQQSEYLGGRKLTKVECAQVYHIQPPLIGILDHATFSNITEQHKNLYQDTLGPWLMMSKEDIELQLLPDFEDSEDVYVEFNIMEKLTGSFEEQTQSLQSAVGRPWMTPNEARARLNLPRSESPGADDLATPLNVIVGGLASPRDTAPKLRAGSGQKGIDSAAPALRARHEEKWAEGLARHYRRQEAAIVSRVPKAAHTGGKGDIGGVWYDADRWNRELAADLLGLNELTATAWAKMVLEKAGYDIDDAGVFSVEAMLPWLEEHARIQAEYINGQMQDGLSEALNDPEPLEAVKGLFNTAATVWAVSQAVSAVTAASSFGAYEGANAGGLKRKTWKVNSSNPRKSHAAQDGVTVGIRETFPNGLRWPGDTRGSADETAGCTCTVSFDV